jgi:hypothetical protein
VYPLQGPHDRRGDVAFRYHLLAVHLSNIPNVPTPHCRLKMMPSPRLPRKCHRIPPHLQTKRSPIF